MSVVKCPTTMTAITLGTSGALVPDSEHNITCTVAEATALCYPPSRPRIHSSIANGNVKGWYPGLGGILVTFAANGAGTTTVGSDDLGTAYASPLRFTELANQGFILVQG